MTYEVVPMKPAHLEQKAYVHFKSWQETYRGLMPDGVLSHHTLERCWKIAEWCGENTFVAVCNGKVVSFARYEETSRDCPEQQMSEIGPSMCWGNTRDTASEGRCWKDACRWCHMKR